MHYIRDLLTVTAEGRAKPRNISVATSQCSPVGAPVNTTTVTVGSSLVWVHRGHVIFLRREALHESILEAAPESAAQIEAQRVGSIQMSNQHFGPLAHEV